MTDIALRWRDESMALHWIDRYASGIDGEPQMSRILACIEAERRASPSQVAPANPAQGNTAEREGLIKKYALACKRNAHEMAGMPITVIMQHFREFADKFAAIGAGGQAAAEPGQFADRVIAACRAYMNTYDVLADEVREHMQASMADALRASDSLSQPHPADERVVDRENLLKHLRSEFSDSYDCTRVWESWSVGTMGEDDFEPIIDRLEEIADGILSVLTHPPYPLDDTKRFDKLRNESWDLRCFDIPTGGDDYDTGWRVVGHWMAEPHERTIAEVYHDDPRAAIDEAISSLSKSEGRS